ncbi:Hypothetical protein SRAE_0000056100 [Strongyloides ratti]|uniref:Uncharacterized protein n=1 Tax=Strongyloides ratti TaxID=34506 RepID=A0A090KZX8_STRRB|nr:Hypothetical protein SRAE_0000056100 [Strongyloides ratti]CEF61437.1 Hypothetical protein SRAE_0000056100 [Strongyloides ratti]
MSLAMNFLSSFTIFTLFVSFVISKSLEFSDKNLIYSSNVKKVLTPVILNDENNHILKKRQETYDNKNGIQVNGDIEGSNGTFNQIQNDIKESHTILEKSLLLFQQKYRQTLQNIQIQISNLATEFVYLEKKIESRKLKQSTTPCPPIPKCPSTTPILVTSPTTSITIKPSTKSTTWFTSTRPTTTQSTTTTTRPNTTQSTTTTTTTYTTSTKPTTKITSTTKLTTIPSTYPTTLMSSTTQTTKTTSTITVTVTTPTTQVVTQTPKIPIVNYLFQMSSAMNMLSSFTIFVFFVSLVFSKSLNISDKNFIDSSNLKNNLTPVILNDEYNHFIEKRQNKYNNSEGIQVNGNIENSNDTFNQIQHDINESHKMLKTKMFYLEKILINYLQSIQRQILNLDTEFYYLEKKIKSKKLRPYTTPCPPKPICSSTTPISMTSPTTPVVTQTPKAPCQQTTTNSSKLAETTTKCNCSG